MVIIIVLSAILFSVIFIIKDNKGSVELSAVLGVVIAPSLISFLTLLAVTGFSLDPNLAIIGTLLSTVSIFFLSHMMLSWDYEKSGVLAGVYLISSFLVELTFYLMAGSY